jgi:hypothetical protein
LWCIISTGPMLGIMTGIILNLNNQTYRDYLLRSMSKHIQLLGVWKIENGNPLNRDT